VRGHRSENDEALMVRAGLALNDEGSRKSYAHAMEPEERARLEKLDAIVRSDELRAEIGPIVDRVCTALSQKPEALMTWEPIPLDIFRQKLPREIRSGWIFVLRAGADTGAERHPNSHQRMMTLHGSGDMRVRADAASSTWESNVLVSDPGAPLERRWISIPPNVWHRPVVGRDAHKRDTAGGREHNDDKTCAD
jgi:hypothetical protein